MLYTIKGWFRGDRVMLTWERGRLRGPAAVLAATLGSDGSLACTDGEISVERAHDALELVRRTLDDIDGVVVRDATRELGWRRRSRTPDPAE